MVVYKKLHYRILLSLFSTTLIWCFFVLKTVLRVYGNGGRDVRDRLGKLLFVISFCCPEVCWYAAVFLGIALI